MQKTLLAIVAVVLVAGGAWFLTRSSTATDPLLGAALAQDAEVDVSRVETMTLGDPDAPIKMVEYGSFTCPHCATFHEGFFTPMKADYIETGQVHFEYRELVRNTVDIWASMLARCGGGTERYFAISDVLFEKQADWIGEGDPETISQELRRIGAAVGYDEEQLDACMTDGGLAQAILAVSNTNAEADEVTGTPTVFVDGERVSLSTYPALREVLDAKLAEAPASE